VSILGFAATYALNGKPYFPDAAFPLWFGFSFVIGFVIVKLIPPKLEVARRPSELALVTVWAIARQRLTEFYRNLT
jgi:hypothetical protein